MKNIGTQYLRVKRLINILAEFETGCQPWLFHKKETLWVISQIKLYVP